MTANTMTIKIMEMTLREPLLFPSSQRTAGLSIQANTSASAKGLSRETRGNPTQNSSASPPSSSAPRMPSRSQSCPRWRHVSCVNSTSPAPISIQDFFIISQLSGVDKRKPFDYTNSSYNFKK